MTVAVNGARAPVRKLLLPCTPAGFFDTSWERRAALLRAPGRAWDELGVTPEAVIAALAEGTLRGRLVTTVGGDDLSRPAPPDLALPLAPDSTLCVGNVERAFPRVGALVDSLMTGLGLAGEGWANLYVSAEGHGFVRHFDTQAVFVVQIHGKKYWAHGPGPVEPWPPAGCADSDERIAAFHDEFPSCTLQPPGALDEVLLEPGDVLYLPGGTWHQARAAGGPSLALSLTVIPCTAWQLIVDALRPRLMADLAWRRDVAAPLDPPPDRLPPGVEAHLFERLGALGRQLAEISPAELHRAWRARRGRVARSPHRGSPLAPSTRLTHGGGLAPGYQRDGDALSLLHATCVVELDAACEPFVRALALTTTFRADEAVAWAPDLTWYDVAPLLETLLREGVLEIEAGEE